MSETLTAPRHEFVDYVDTSDRVIGSSTLGSVQGALQTHRWFFVFIYNDAGEVLLQRRGPEHETSANCWDVTCEGHVASGEDYPAAARRTLSAQLGIPLDKMPLRPFLKLPAGLDTSMRFIRLFTCGPFNGPFQPASEEYAYLAFCRLDDIDYLVESSPGEVGESLAIAWHYRNALEEQLANPTEPLPPPSDRAPALPPPEAVPVPTGPVSREGFALPSDAAAGMADFNARHPGLARRESAFAHLSIGQILGLFFLAARYSFMFIAMGLTLVSYSQQYGPLFTVGFCAALFIHEIGHVMAAACLGLQLTVTMYLPVIGAFLRTREDPQELWKEGVIAIAGPVCGAMFATACLVAGLALKSHLLLALSASVYCLNLIHMIPLKFMDGGRVTAAVSSIYWLIGLVVLAMGVMAMEGKVQAASAVLLFYLGFNSMLSSPQSVEEQERAFAGIKMPFRYLMGGLYLALIAAMYIGLYQAIHAMHPVANALEEDEEEADMVDEPKPRPSRIGF